MKVIKTKLIERKKYPAPSKYQITLEVTDKDIEMFEDFATTYAPFDYKKIFYDENYNEKKALVDSSVLDYKKKYHKWMMETYLCFSELWQKYDED